MTRISFSAAENSLEFIINWYNDQKESLQDYKTKIIQSCWEPSFQNKFASFTYHEIEDYFETSEKELDLLTCFNIISATEAKLRLDFHNRVLKKGKTEICRKFRALYKQKKNKVSLEKDILESWKDVYHDKKLIFSNYTGLLKFRHWLAHGRYWTPKFGHLFDVEYTLKVSEQIFKIIS